MTGGYEIEHLQRSADPNSFGNDYDVEKIRADFPSLHQVVHGKPLVYLDNAATSQKPRAVIDAIVKYYEQENSNVHRGLHFLSEVATRKYEEARDTVQNFIHAADRREIVFVRGTTEAINLVAQTFGRQSLKRGDEILITGMEHHSNIVPWQLLSEQIGCALRVSPINDEGDLLLDNFEELLTARTRIVAMPHVSNVLGTINPVKELARLAHAKNIPVVIDGAQAVSHMPVDVQDIDCDFYCFSSHKVFGPTGIGVLYGKRELMEKMPPYQGGGDMISFVTFEKSTYNVLPYKFEAGTPHIEGAIGLAAALKYIQGIGLEKIAAYESHMLQHATEALSEIPGIRIIGNSRHKAGVIAFVIEGVHAHDVGTILDTEGIAVRAGHHCSMPLMHRFGVPATARISLAFYNTKEEIDLFIRALGKVREVFGDV